MKPLGDRVLIRPVMKQVDESALIIKPEVYDYTPDVTGWVVAVGDRSKGDVKVGDFVFFSPVAGQDIVVGAEVLIMMRESEILAVEEA